MGAELHDSAGAVYVYVRSGDAWTEETILVASDASTAFDRFGHAVALRGDTALIGSPYDDLSVGGNDGSAYVFVRSGTTWTQQAKIIDSAHSSGSYFGISVSLIPDAALVGSVGGLFGGGGEALFFVRVGTTWAQHSDLRTGTVGLGYGHSVWLGTDGTAIVGAPTSSSSYPSYAYVYEFSGSAWARTATLEPFRGWARRSRSAGAWPSPHLRRTH